MAMYIDLIVNGFLKEYHESKKFQLWMDNCGPHMTKAIEELLKELDFTDCFAFFPPNCTDILQPLDLIVNKILKSMVRKENAYIIIQDMQNFRAKYALEMKKPLEERRRLKFVATKPEYQQATIKLLNLMNSFNNISIDSSLKLAQSIKDCFVNVGLVMGEGESAFKLYNSKKLDTTGTSTVEPIGAGSSIELPRIIEIKEALDTLLDDDADIFDEVSGKEADDEFDGSTIEDDDDYQEYDDDKEDIIDFEIIKEDAKEINNNIDSDDDDDINDDVDIKIGSKRTSSNI
jgi:hypothetical protein